MEPKEYITFLEKLIVDKKYQMTLEELECYFSDLGMPEFVVKIELLTKELHFIQEEINNHQDNSDETDKNLINLKNSIINLVNSLNEIIKNV